MQTNSNGIGPTYYNSLHAIIRAFHSDRNVQRYGYYYSLINRNTENMQNAKLNNSKLLQSGQF